MRILRLATRLKLSSEGTSDAQARKTAGRGLVSMQMQARRLTYFPRVVRRHLRRNECCPQEPRRGADEWKRAVLCDLAVLRPWSRQVCTSSLTRERGRHGQEKRSTKEWEKQSSTHDTKTKNIEKHDYMCFCYFFVHCLMWRRQSCVCFLVTWCLACSCVSF